MGSNSTCNIIYSILKHLIEKIGICFHFSLNVIDVLLTTNRGCIPCQDCFYLSMDQYYLWMRRGMMGCMGRSMGWMSWTVVWWWRQMSYVWAVMYWW